jgi:hypothetical protein
MLAILALVAQELHPSKSPLCVAVCFYVNGQHQTMIGRPMFTFSNRLQRVVVAATAALMLLLLALVTVSRAPISGSDVELAQLKAAAQQAARHLYVQILIFEFGILLWLRVLVVTHIQVPWLVAASEWRHFQP